MKDEIATVPICKCFIGHLALGEMSGFCYVMTQTLQDLAVPSVDLSSAHLQHQIRQLYLQPEVFYYFLYFL